eukprot:4594375-Lingulodinium_polyedra.AAC.1
MERRGRAQHRRYPGTQLVFFVVDARGRRGREAEAWLLGSVWAQAPGERKVLVFRFHMAGRAVSVAR